jgi:hypothetical protein
MNRNNKFCGGARLEPHGTAACYGSTISTPDDKGDERQVFNNGGMIIGKRKPKFSDRNLHNATSSTRNHTWTTLGLNQDLRCEKPATPYSAMA